MALEAVGAGLSVGGWFVFSTAVPGKSGLTVVTAQVTCVTFAGSAATVTAVYGPSLNYRVVVQVDSADNGLSTSMAPDISEVSPGCWTPRQKPGGSAGQRSRGSRERQRSLAADQVLGAGQTFGVDVQGAGTDVTGQFSIWQHKWPDPNTKWMLRTATATCVDIAGNSATITGTVKVGSRKETVVVAAEADPAKYGFFTGSSITKVPTGCDTTDGTPKLVPAGDVEMGPTP